MRSTRKLVRQGIVKLAELRAKEVHSRKGIVIEILLAATALISLTVVWLAVLQ